MTHETPGVNASPVYKALARIRDEHPNISRETAAITLLQAMHRMSREALPELLPDATRRIAAWTFLPQSAVDDGAITIDIEYSHDTYEDAGIVIYGPPSQVGKLAAIVHAHWEGDEPHAVTAQKTMIELHPDWPRPR